MKRIISLILVLATAFLTLTGCAYRYSKDNMEKYAEFNKDAFHAALYALNITKGAFSPDSDREGQVNDKIAQELLKVTDTTKKFSGQLGLYDSVYFCYYAEDKDGNKFYLSKLDESKPTNIQLGLTTIEGLNKKFADALLAAGDISNYIYSTSATNYVKSGDVVSVSYMAAWDDDNNPSTPDKTDVVWNEFVSINGTDPLGNKLLSECAQVGVMLPGSYDITVDDGNGTNIVKKYTNVKVESLVKGAEDRADKVEDGDIANVSFKMTFSGDKFYDADKNDYKLPDGFKNMSYTVSDKKIVVTVSYLDVEAVQAAEGAVKSFVNLIVGKAAGATTDEDMVGTETIGGESVEVTYSNVKINWIDNNSDTRPYIVVKDTPYEAINADKSNRKTEKNVYGKSIELNGKELTYHIFPVYYIDVADPAVDVEEAAKLLLKNYASIINGTQTKEHDHVEEEHEHVTEYIFATLNDTEYKNGDKTLATLIGELASLSTTYTTKKSDVDTKLSALTTAYSKFAGVTNSAENYEELRVNKENAETAYNSAKYLAEEELAKMNDKIKEILGCKKGEAGAAAALVSDYNKYQYDNLEAAYDADVREKLAAAIIDALKANVTFNGKLPKRAVKNAYNAIMDAYQYDFYEGKFTSGSSGSSTSLVSETNYYHYNGDFNRYLIEKVVNNNGGMKEVKAAIQAQAEKSVQEVIYIYVLTQMVEEAWHTELSLTKDEKKKLEEDLEYTALLYQQYYGYTYEYNLEEAFDGAQLDKVMEFLLEVVTVRNAQGEEADVYIHLDYNK